MDINNYLGLDLYPSGRVKNIYIIDIKNKRLYCGYHILGESYDKFEYHNFYTYKSLFHYLIPIKQKEKLKYFMNLKSQDIIGLHVEDFFNDYDLKEWLI